MKEFTAENRKEFTAESAEIAERKTEKRRTEKKKINCFSFSFDSLLSVFLSAIFALSAVIKLPTTKASSPALRGSP
ncbi:MAG: hypothetical protein IRY99_21150 [Isosphaeraceae bacterium]|nr:hypothetical protein [Isosphaeraceae bacterium]